MRLHGRVRPRCALAAAERRPTAGLGCRSSGGRCGSRQWGRGGDERGCKGGPAGEVCAAARAGAAGPSRDPKSSAWRAGIGPRVRGYRNRSRDAILRPRLEVQRPRQICGCSVRRLWRRGRGSTRALRLPNGAAARRPFGAAVGPEAHRARRGGGHRGGQRLSGPRGHQGLRFMGLGERLGLRPRGRRVGHPLRAFGPQRGRLRENRRGPHGQNSDAGARGGLHRLPHGQQARSAPRAAPRRLPKLRPGLGIDHPSSRGSRGRRQAADAAGTQLGCRSAGPAEDEQAPLAERRPGRIEALGGRLLPRRRGLLGSATLARHG
mmetsp:Transcript_157163/g.504205  ORF Transcript_157163/g.504205 Transcript_157163/m.504205 type:complete len:321 (+) Transcript_157163:1099-2061(+)